MRLDDYAIKIVQGDTVDISLKLQNLKGKKYCPKEDDTFYFSLQQKFVKKPFCLKKEISKKDLKIYLTSEETANMPYGEYRYDVSIHAFRDGEEYVETFIADKNFILLPLIQI